MKLNKKNEEYNIVWSPPNKKLFILFQHKNVYTTTTLVQIKVIESTHMCMVSIEFG